jgi:hypothetical protein
VPYAHYVNPQSLNLYSYVENNPTITGDPDVHTNAPDDVGLFVRTATGDAQEKVAKAPPAQNNKLPKMLVEFLTYRKNKNPFQRDRWAPSSLRGFHDRCMRDRDMEHWERSDHEKWCANDPVPTMPHDLTSCQGDLDPLHLKTQS